MKTCDGCKAEFGKHWRKDGMIRLDVTLVAGGSLRLYLCLTCQRLEKLAEVIKARTGAKEAK